MTNEHGFREKYSERSASVSMGNRLFFPATVKRMVVDGRVIILSPETANWLVVDEEDIPILDRLIAGETIGAVVAFAQSLGGIERLKMLLAQITARQFASVTAPPSQKIDRALQGAYFYLTNACNLRCSHCYMFSGKAGTGELTAAEWVNVVDDFSECGGTNITFSGGEVLAKRGWLKIVERAHKRNISSTILTNGTLWQRDHIKAVAPFLAEVQVSLDGPSESVNALTRGQGAFQKAISTAKAFAAEGVRTSIAMTPTPETLHLFCDGFQEFFEENIRGTGINVRISHKLLRGREVSALAGEEKARYEEIVSHLADLIYPSSKLRSFSLEHPPNEPHFNCGFGGASISASGDVYPCNRISDVLPIGNVRSDKLGNLIRRLKESETATDVDNIAPCKWCDLRYICGGGCRIDDYYIADQNGNRFSFRESPAVPNSVRKDTCSDDYRLSLLRQMVGAKDYLFPT